MGMIIGGAGIGTCTGASLRWQGEEGTVVTLVGKVAYRFDGAGRLTPQPAPFVREPLREEGGMLAGVRVPGDVARCKPCGEVLVVGRARWHPPRDQAHLGLYVTRSGTTLVSKQIAVQLPEPRDGVALRWENARGGIGVASNPIGRPDAPLASPLDAEAPAGFSPLDPSWASRRALLGDARIDPLGTVHETPSDPTYFQDAPVDQRIVGPLLPGDGITLDGMAADAPRIQLIVPPLHGRAQLWREGLVAGELALAIDTLVVDLDAATVTFVARADVARAGSDDLRAWIALGTHRPPWPSEPPPSHGENGAEQPSIPSPRGALTLPVAATESTATGPRAPFRVAEPGTPTKNVTIPGAPWGEAPAPVLPAQPGAAQTLAPFGVEVRRETTEPPVGAATLPARPSVPTDASTPLEAAMLARLNPSKAPEAPGIPIAHAPWATANVPPPEVGQGTLTLAPEAAADQIPMAARLRAHEEATREQRSDPEAARRAAEEQARRTAEERAERRRLEAEAFEREQRALAEAEARRTAEKVARAKEQAAKLRDGMYGGFGKK